METVGGRVYGGRTARQRAEARRERLLSAGLDVLSSPGVASVRAVIEQSGLTPRYFYEAFANLAELEIALFDQLTAKALQIALEVERSTKDQSARSQVRALVAAMGSYLLDDPRRGRFMLITSVGSEVLAPKRRETLLLFASLLALRSGIVGPPGALSPAAVKVRTEFLLGGFIEAVVAGFEAGADQTSLINEITDLFVAITDLSRPAPGGDFAE